MYILFKVIFCRPYSYAATGYILRYKSFFCTNCRELLKAWRWICRKQLTSDFFISFSAYFCSENGISAISSYSMSLEIANIFDDGICKEIYFLAREIALCEHLCSSFDIQFDDYSKIFD